MVSYARAPTRLQAGWAAVPGLRSGSEVYVQGERSPHAQVVFKSHLDSLFIESGLYIILQENRGWDYMAQGEDLHNTHILSNISSQEATSIKTEKRSFQTNMHK